MTEEFDIERIREDRRRAQKAAEDALEAAQRAGASREQIERTLAVSNKEAENYRRIMRQARIIH